MNRFALGSVQMVDVLINNALDLWQSALDFTHAYAATLKALGLWEAGGFVCSVGV